LAAKDYRLLISASLFLQNDLTQHSDILKELMERVKDEDQKSVEEEVEGDIQLVYDVTMRCTSSPQPGTLSWRPALLKLYSGL